MKGVLPTLYPILNAAISSVISAGNSGIVIQKDSNPKTLQTCGARKIDRLKPRAGAGLRGVDKMRGGVIVTGQ